jgi:aspartate aminotransferase-like enzyme
MSLREWVLLNPGPANTTPTVRQALVMRIDAGQGDIRRYAFRVANMGTLGPKDMAAVDEAFARSLEELGCRPSALASPGEPR